MPEHSNPDVKLASRHGSDAQGDGEVGRIVIGARHFGVALAAELPYQSMGEEICRFEVVGVSLVVFETKDQRRPNAIEAADGLAGRLTGRLTGRELEVAVLVSQGYATKNIAYRLQISQWTVATYLRRIFAKLDVDNRAAMVYRCAPLIGHIADVGSSARQVEFSSSPGRSRSGSRHLQAESGALIR
jgi:DNA-binding CsgD family transcriptional regulator